MKVQIPVVVAAAGLITAAAFVVVPLVQEAETAPGISVGEPTETSAPADPTSGPDPTSDSAPGPDSTEPATPAPGASDPSGSARLERAPEPKESPRSGRPDRSGVCEWDDGEWECDPDDDDDDDDEDDDEDVDDDDD